VAARTVFGAIARTPGGSIRLPLGDQRHHRHPPDDRPGVQLQRHPARLEHGHRRSDVPHGRGLRLMFGAIAGPDPRDAGTADVPVPDYTADLRRGVEGLRIGVIPDYFFFHLQPPVERAVREALKTYESLAPRSSTCPCRTSTQHLRAADGGVL
jgi:aspartyl-tRNA(Asn)/glutamyl-tRNA(Gln) amidotransferase subunit A